MAKLLAASHPARRWADWPHHTWEKYMMLRRFVLSIPALVFMATSSDAATIIQTANYEGSTYHLIASDTGSRISWAEAETFAVSLGGHLVTVDDADENAFVLNTFGPTANAVDPSLRGLRSLWIGLSDTAQEGMFVWSSGDPVTYTNWIGGLESNLNGDQDYVGMVVGPGFGFIGGWHDIFNSFPTGDVTFGVVEIKTGADPEPSSLALLGIAVLGLAGCEARRRKS
jgi:hypothetical protein